MPRISKKPRFENEAASTMQGTALDTLLDSDSGLRKWKRTTTVCVAYWLSRTTQYPAYDTSNEALGAQQADYQSKKPLLDISNT